MECILFEKGELICIIASVEINTIIFALVLWSSTVKISKFVQNENKKKKKKKKTNTEILQSDTNEHWQTKSSSMTSTSRRSTLIELEQMLFAAAHIKLNVARHNHHETRMEQIYLPAL